MQRRTWMRQLLLNKITFIGVGCGILCCWSYLGCRTVSHNWSYAQFVAWYSQTHEDLDIQWHTEVIEKRVSQIQSPIDVGRLPLKIGSGFAGFTADQWLNWVVIYSPVALKGILPPADLTCWIFTLELALYYVQVTKKLDVQTADQYLLHFCRSFQALYGPEACTPNMHLHLHLKESLLDYGPVYAFWLFAFERFNGILRAYSTNNKGIEVQLM